MREKLKALLVRTWTHVKDGSKIVLLLAVSAYATQTPPAAVDEAGRTLERCLIEVEHLRATCHSDAEIRSLEGRLRAANNLLDVYKAQVARLTGMDEANTGMTASTIARYEARIKGYEDRLAMNQRDLNRLRNENTHLRTTRNVLVAFIVGLGVSLAWALSQE
jgi:hypothetical protein